MSFAFESSASGSAVQTDDFAALQTIEHDYYEQGYADGAAHGKLHGIFEGRALGRDKGFELWEEIGFYEGQAMLLQSLPDLKPRTRQAAEQLLALVDAFPMKNDHQQASNVANEGPDMQGQLTAIRSKYRILCAGTFLRPRIQSTENSL